MFSFIKTKPFDDQQTRVKGGKRLSEEGPNYQSKKERVALTDVTNKQSESSFGRLTKIPSGKKKDIEQIKVVSKVSTEIKSSSSIDEKPGFMFHDNDITMLDEAAWESIPHTDIDHGDDQADPQLCRVYVNEIYAYLRENEGRYQADDYMARQKDINPGMRAILVDWLVEVAEEYKLSSETLYLTVSYLDRYLSRFIVHRGKLQLVGVACMLLASKYEEIYAPAVEEFVYISDNTYTKEEIFEMESQVLNVLEFCLTTASTKNFLRRFLKAAGADAVVVMFANYLCELSLQEFCFIRWLPSLIAASAVYLALQTASKVPIWTSTLDYYTRHHPSEPDMKACVLELWKLHKGAHQSPLQAVQEKYSQSRFYKVAVNKVMPPLPNIQI